MPLDLLPSGEGLIGFWVRKPVGVVVGIAGFNYPLLLAAHKIAPALAAGCPVIVKPAPATPLATLWLVHVLREALVAAGGPAGAVQLVTGDVEVGVALTTDRRIGAVSFTGSAAVGHPIARDAAPTKVLLELGSNAARRGGRGRRPGGGRRRGGAGRLLRLRARRASRCSGCIVEEPVREEFLSSGWPARIGEVVVGDPRDADTRVGGADRRAATARVLDWVERGGRAPAAGCWPAGRSRAACSRRPCCSTCPTAAPRGTRRSSARSSSSARCPTSTRRSTAVNASRYGLHASVFTGSLETAFAAIDRLDVGGVVVNEVPGFRSDVMPYGGMKDSGVGREGPRFAIEELTVTRMAVIRPSTRKG